MASQVPTGVWGVGVQDCHFLFSSSGTTPGSGWLPSRVAQEAPCPASAGAAPWGHAKVWDEWEVQERKEREGDSVHSRRKD